MIIDLEFTQKLIEIAILVYAIAFKILMIGGQLVTSIIEAGRKLVIKSKKEDTIGQLLKGLYKILTENFY